MQKITPFLTFQSQAHEAARFYVSLFEGSRILETMPGQDGTPLTLTVELAGQPYVFMNGGPTFQPLTEAVSLSVSCETQAEVDRYWDALTANGGKEIQCGWLVDRFGLSWQIVPRILPELLMGPDRARAGRVMQAMLKMVKLDVATLERA